MKQDFQGRHLKKLLTDKAGSDESLRKTLARLYLVASSNDPEKDAKLKKGIADAEAWYLKAYGQGPWGFQKALSYLIEKEDAAYEDVYKGSELRVR